MRRINKEISTYLLNRDSYSENEREQIRKYFREKLDKYVEAINVLTDL